jgi:uncharacterized MAPEG superfamily protein
MPFAFWSILIAALLPLVWTVVAKAGVPYDNHAPRNGLAQASGYRQRANWAQLNAWEAFAPFAAAVIVAWLMKLPLARLNAAAAVFVLARVAHGVCYLMDLATLRSLCWLLGMAVVLYLFIAAACI